MQKATFGGMEQEVQFSEEARGVIGLVRDSRSNLFITGRAGTGKSTLLEYLVKTCREEAVVLAPTGIAAMHVGGETIHSFFRLKPGFELDEAKHMRLNKAMMERYRSLQTIFIDEISMVRADILDAVDVFLKRTRNSREFFGGVRMVFFGDLFQLPPVVTTEERDHFLESYDSPWFFSAALFRRLDLFSEGFLLRRVELRHIYRQNDPKFIAALNAIRERKADPDSLAFLNTRVRDGFRPPDREKWMSLVNTNQQAARINAGRLASLPGPAYSHSAQSEGKPGNVLPNDILLELKAGAQVMFLNNDQERRWVNGSLGTVRAFSNGGEHGELLVQVLLDNGKTVMVGPHTWPISKYRFQGGKFVREEIGSFTQLPFRLAWAITIHKSQGKTFRKVFIDLGPGSFAHGQCYVALSRCTGPEGLVLQRPIRKSDVILDEKMLDFLRN